MSAGMILFSARGTVTVHVCLVDVVCRFGIARNTDFVHPASVVAQPHDHKMLTLML